MEIVDLKEDRSFIAQYVELRNRYAEFLLTHTVTLDETEEWLDRENIEIRGLVKNGILLGAVILYLNRNGEIAIFVSEGMKGIGSELLNIIEGVARENKLKSVWAWVLFSNIAAQKAFAKKGYKIEGATERNYKDNVVKGVVFKKLIGVCT